ncbi:MAG: alkaline phosphatase D family protein [Actinomycetota bacterium]
MDRRDFLKTSVGVGAGLTIARRFPSVVHASAAVVEDSPFRHGVASGDPLPTQAIIWTRVTPSDAATPGSKNGDSVEVRWEVATDPGFRKIEAEGNMLSHSSSDHTIKVDVDGLHPGTAYHYRFRAAGKTSRVGRLRTAPEPGADNTSLRFGMVSCSNYEGGFFTAYGHLAQHELDFVLHLGDYIYEYGAGGYGPGAEIGRVHTPAHEIVSLSDYRTRYGQYREDVDLQDLHAAAPFVTIWDDHEVANDAYAEGAENHQEEEGDYIARRDRAYQAYFEWMPVRQRRDPRRLYRHFRFGTLADLHMLDLRQYRNEQPSNQADPSKDDPARTITGDKQMEWFKQSLTRHRPTWRLIGNQVMFIPWDTAPEVPFNIDAWDGYRADRQELIDHFAGNSIDNVAFLTGDIHTSWASDVPLDKTTYGTVTGSVCTEFVCPSVTSDNLDEIAGTPYRSSIPAEEAIKANNRWVKHVELDSHGYSLVDLNPERLQVDFHYISDRTDPKATESFASGWMTEAGSNTVVEARQPIPDTRGA